MMLKPVPFMGNCLIKTDHLWTRSNLPTRLLEAQSNQGTRNFMPATSPFMTSF